MVDVSFCPVFGLSSLGMRDGRFRCLFLSSILFLGGEVRSQPIFPSSFRQRSKFWGSGGGRTAAEDTRGRSHKRVACVCVPVACTLSRLK